MSDVLASAVHTVAEMLDHPSVYMGGPSPRSTRRAEQILAAVAPLIAAAERERCAGVVDENATHCTGFIHEVLASNAAAIRALD